MGDLEQQAREIAGKLNRLESERLTGWKGPAGAAYNAVSEDLAEAGLLNADWSLSEIGLAVRAALLNPTRDEEMR